MTEQQSEPKLPPAGIPLPAGIELSPEAKRLLERQLNHQIVSGYWVSKALYAFAGIMFLGAAGFMVFMSFKVGIISLRAAFLALLVIGIPAACGYGFLRLAIRY